MEITQTQTETIPQSVDIPSWQEVDSLFEPRSPEFQTLRSNVLDQQRQELMGRIATNPTKDLEEVSAGVYREQLEPQCRDAVLEIRRKGYQTYNSGFGVGNLQVLDGMLGKIDAPTAQELMDEGYLVYETEPGNVSIAFQPEQPDLDEMTSRWNRLAALLPDRGEPAESDDQAREAYLDSFTEPGTYSNESAFRLEHSTQTMPEETNSHQPQIDSLHRPHLGEGAANPSVDQEIARLTEALNGGEAGETLDSFNNFLEILPGGNHWRTMERYEDIFDDSPLYDEELDTYREPTESEKQQHSELYLNNPLKNRMLAAQEIIEHAPDEYRAELDTRRNQYLAARDTNPHSDETLLARNEYLRQAVPIYQALLEMGYTPADLWR